MKQFYTFFLFLFFSITFCFPQANLYVGTNGVDIVGNGTSSNPFATINFAAEQTQPGDTVFVYAGTYRNADFGDGDIWEGDNLAKVTANGSEGNYITFMPYPGDKVLLEFDATYGILFSNASYIKFTGFELKGIADQITQTEAENAWGLYKKDDVIYNLATELEIDITNANLIGTEISKISDTSISKPSYYNGRAIVALDSHHIDITNNIVRDVPSAAIRAQKSDYINIIGNSVFRNTYWTTLGVGAITVAESTVNPVGDTFTGVKIRLEKNKVYNNENKMVSWNPEKSFIHFVIDEGTGLFLTRNKDTYTHGKIRIANNLAYNNGASGIVCHVTDRTIIEFNTVFKNGTNNTSFPGGIGVNNVDNVIIRNNISYARPTKWALGILATPVTNLIVESNIIYNENGAENIHRNISDGWAELDPLFEDASIYNFTLSKNSPAIDNSTTTEEPIEEDINGTIRKDGFPDIGAYERTKISAFEMIKKMGRGINLGNVFSAPAEGNWAPAVEQKYFQDVAEAGFSTVRIPMDFFGTRTSGDTSIWSSNEGTSSDYAGSINDYNVSSIYLDRIEEVIDWAMEAGLIVIIDIHGSTLKTEFQYTFDRKNTHPNERTSPTSAKRLADLDKFTAIWTAISNRFEPKSENLLFEVINEPYFEITAEDMNSINSLIINTIRNTGGNNTTRNIIITGGTENTYLAPTTIDAAVIANDDYLIATFHYYNPNDFTKSSEDDKDQETWGSITDKNSIDSDFNVVYNWASTNNIPILLGEFGADNTGGYNYSTGDLNTNSTNETGFSDGGPEHESRIEFHRYLAEKAISLGFAFTAWDAGPESNKTIHKRNDAASTINYDIDYFSVTSYNPNITTPSTVVDTSIWVEDVKNALLGIFSLSSNNFNIEIISETCPGKNNGQLLIHSNEEYNYETTIKEEPYNFTTDLVVTDLAPGLYPFCISISGKTYKQCFVVEIIEGSTVLGKSSVSSGKASVEIEVGTAPFTIYVNQKELFKTSSPIFNIDVKYGDIIEVKTAVPCEGIYSKAIEQLNELIIYPNPSENIIYLKTSSKITKLEIFNLQGQQVLFFKNNLEAVSLKSLNQGVYILKIYLENNEIIFKNIIKN